MEALHDPQCAINHLTKRFIKRYIEIHNKAIISILLVSHHWVQQKQWQAKGDY